MMLSLIVAVGPDGEIGLGGKLPWPVLLRDMKWFQARTMGKPVIMGRRTWESLPVRPLRGRMNVVLTGDLDWRPGPGQAGESPTVYHCGLGRVLDRLDAKGHAEAVVIGGARVYRDALPLADRVYLTRVERLDGGAIPADTFFPAYPLPAADWDERPAFDRYFCNADHRVGFSVFERKAPCCTPDPITSESRTPSARSGNTSPSS